MAVFPQTQPRPAVAILGRGYKQSDGQWVNQAVSLTLDQISVAMRLLELAQAQLESLESTDDIPF